MPAGTQWADCPVKESRTSISRKQTAPVQLSRSTLDLNLIALVRRALNDRMQMAGAAGLEAEGGALP